MLGFGVRVLGCLLGDNEARARACLRLEGVKETVAEILGGGEGFGGGEEGGFCFGAKKREMTCCFGFPMMLNEC